MREDPKAKLLFFHGLNTFGDDAVHLGPFKLGWMHQHWAAKIAQRHPQIEFTPIFGLGVGTIAEQAANALHSVRNISGDLHFLGQSTGGLVARQLAHDPELKARVRSIITVGTPHHGAMAAEFAVRTHDQNPWLPKVLRWSGYNLRERLRIFDSLTSRALEEFNRKYDERGVAPCYSLICALPRLKAAWPLQFFYDQIHPKNASKMRSRSDGFITAESQMFDSKKNRQLDFSVGEFELDHFGELGFFFVPQAPRLLRSSAGGVKEFDRLVDVTARIVSSCNIGSDC